MSNMDDYFMEQLDAHRTTFKNSLEHIIDTYSKLQYQDGGVEVDLESTNEQTLKRYMNQSRAQLNKLESKSLADLREESIRAQDVTKDPQLDLTCHEDGSDDDSCVSAAHVSMESDGTVSNDSTQLSVRSLDMSQRNLSEMDIPFEDQDEDLDMSPRSQSSSLVELYPSMINRIGRAWHRQHVAEAADSVLRRYRRWRQQSKKGNLNDTFIVTQRYGNRKPQNVTSQALLKESTRSPLKTQFVGREASPRSRLHMVTNVQDRQAQYMSPRKVRREQPVLVMDFSGPSETSMLNETFTVPEASWLREQAPTHKFSPSRPRYPTANVLDQSLRSRRLSLPTYSLQTDDFPAYASEIRPRPDIYGSPVRQSPSQVRMMSSFSRSPHAFSRSPKAHSSMENFSREPLMPRLSISPRKPTVPLRMLHPQGPHRSPRTPRSATAAESHNRLRRHLSFDSSMPPYSVELSPKEVDEEFLKLYHKFVCQNKSSVFNRHPCRVCARSSEVTRGPSSSALAALALSPHRSLLRKRHREFDWDSNTQSEHCRDDYCPSSPGSKRHRGETLTPCLSPSEYEQSHHALSYSSTRPSMFRRLNTRRRAAADFSLHGKFT